MFSSSSQVCTAHLRYFVKRWEATCRSTRTNILLIPKTTLASEESSRDAFIARVAVTINAGIRSLSRYANGDSIQQLHARVAETPFAQNFIEITSTACSRRECWIAYDTAARNSMLFIPPAVMAVVSFRSNSPPFYLLGSSMSRNKHQSPGPGLRCNSSVGDITTVDVHLRITEHVISRRKRSEQHLATCREREMNGKSRSDHS